MGNNSYRFGDFLLAKARRELWRGHGRVQLSSRAFDCLVYLIEHRDRAVDKDELVAAIWRRTNVSDTQLGQTVLRARRAVGDDGQLQRIIRTVPGFGYRWVAEIDALPETPTAVVMAAVAAAPQPEPSARHAEAVTAPARGDPGPLPPTGSGRRWRRRVVMALAVICVIVLGIKVLPFGKSAPTAQGKHGIAVVAPLQVDAPSSSAWLRLGAMDLIAERLRTGGMSVPPSESIVALLLSTAAVPNSDAELQAIRRSTAADMVVRGKATQAAGGWAMQLHAITTDGAVLAVEARNEDALHAAAEAADRLLARLGRSRPPLAPASNALQDRLQRAQAAMLANDLAGARDILVSDPELERSEPELRYRLAQLDFRAGRYREADSSLTSLLAETPPGESLVRARLLNSRGAVRIRRDDFAGADQDFDAAVSAIESGDDPEELGRALMGRAVTRATRHDFPDALADFGQARVQLEKAGDALGIARVDSNLGGMELDRDRPEDALGYLGSAAERFEFFGAINELFETLASLFSARMTLLQPGSALAISDRSWALRDRATDPNQALNLRLDRADVFIALGRYREAGGVLDSVPSDAPQANPFVARRVHALRARLALGLGNPERAITEARRAFTMTAPADDSGEGQAEIALVHQRALVALSKARAAPPIEERLQEASRRAFKYPIQLLIEAEWADFQGQQTAAGNYFQSALDSAEKRGEPADIAAVTESYGPWLLRNGRLQEATAVIGRVSPWADRDYACALLQVRLFGALRQNGPWRNALVRARALAGEREIPAELLGRPQA